MRIIFREIAAILRGQWLLLPRINIKLVRIYGPITIEGNRRNINWGNRCKVHRDSHFRLSWENNEGELVLGDNSTIEVGCILNSHNGQIKIGERAYIGIRSIVQGKGHVEIGAWAMLGPCVQIYSSDHIYKTGKGPYRDRGETASPIRIGNNVWIGASAIILRGTTLGDNCVVAAAAVAKGNYEPDTLIQCQSAIAKSLKPIADDK